MFPYQEIFQLFNPYLGFLMQYPVLYSLVILVTFFIVAKTIVYIFEKILLIFARKTDTKVDDTIIQRTTYPVSILLLLIGLRVSIIPLGLKTTLLTYLNLALSTFAILVSTFLVIIIFDVIIDNWAKHWAKTGRRHKIDKQVINLFRKITRIVILTFGLMFILNFWGISASPLLASLGVAGIAIAFAMQQSLGNLFGGISIIVDKSIETGDIIELEDATVGTVFEVGFRSTKIRTFDNEVVIIPNGKLASSQIKNYAPPDPSARLAVPFCVAYGSDIKKVKKLVLDSLKGIKGLCKDKETSVRFLEMANSSLNFKAYLYVEDYRNRYFVKDQANTLIYDALNKAKVNIPFPQMDVHLKK